MLIQRISGYKESPDTKVLALQLAAACTASSKLDAGFSEKYHISPLSTLVHCCINVVSLGKALYPQVLHSTQV